MIEAISIERSLFFINQSHVDEFNKLAEQLKGEYSLNLNGAISDDDVWTTAFNIWLLTLPDEMLVLESVEKTFYYSSNFIIYEYLKNDYHFNYIRNHSKRSNEICFLFSIHLTNQMNNYWYTLLMEHGLSDIVEKNKSRNYFEAHNDTDQNIENFINDQARFVKVLVQDLKSNDTFKRLVKDCCDKTFAQMASSQQNKSTLTK